MYSAAGMCTGEAHFPAKCQMPIAWHVGVSQKAATGSPAFTDGGGASIRNKDGSQVGKGVERQNSKLETGLATIGSRQVTGEILHVSVCPLCRYLHM